jgi:hypothetical protein
MVPVESSCLRRRQGLLGLRAADHQFKRVRGWLPMPVYLVDNVATTGATIEPKCRSWDFTERRWPANLWAERVVPRQIGLEGLLDIQLRRSSGQLALEPLVGLADGCPPFLRDGRFEGLLTHALDQFGRDSNRSSRLVTASVCTPCSLTTRTKIAWVYIYNLAWMFVFDLVKIALSRVLGGWNLHGGSSLSTRMQTSLQPHGNLRRYFCGN